MHSPEHLQKHLSAKKELEKKILNLRGVTGVSVGYKTTNGELTEEIAIVVRVFQKLTPTKLSKEENVVDLIKQQYPTLNVDVVEASRPIEEFEEVSIEQVSIINDNTKYRPLVGGCKIFVKGKQKNHTGTGGVIAHSKTIEGRNSILTCAHVGETADCFAFQPSEEENNKIGIVGNIAYSANVDGAEIKLNNTTTWEAKINGIGSIKGTKEPDLNNLVKKYGYKTGLTKGKITNIAFSGTTTKGRVFRDQIIISKRKFEDDPLSAGGDSGSAWVSDTGEKVEALHWGGDGIGNEAYASPIGDVERELNVDISTE
jgi:hypothetical protein